MDSLRALKISAPKVAEPWKTLEKRLMCPHCGGSAYVMYPWDASDFQRAQKTREAIEEHRKICLKTDGTAHTVYEISYPRI